MRAEFDSNTVSNKPEYLTFPSIGMNFASTEKEGYFGFGQRWSVSNQRGKKIQCWLEEAAWPFLNVTAPLPALDGASATYMPMPWFISNYGYGIEIDSSYRTEFDMAYSRKDEYSIKIDTNKIDAIFYFGRSPAETLGMFTRRRGLSLIPPHWMFGMWKQLDYNGNNCSTAPLCTQKMMDHDIPFSVCQGYTHFFPNGAQYGNEKALLAENTKLHEMGIKSTTYFNPFVGVDHPLYKQLADKKYFTTDLNGNPFNFMYMDFHVAQIDYTYEPAIQWYQSIIASAVKNMSFDGFMYDYAEYTPINSMFNNGMTGRELHNNYSILYDKAAFDYFKSIDPTPNDEYAPDYVYFTRSGYTASGSLSWAHWTGDPGSDWGEMSGLPAQITACLTAGLSGVSFCGSDIGGYTCILRPVLTEELLTRWVQYGAFSGIMRDETAGAMCGNRTQIFSSPSMARVYRKFAKLRTALFPYIYTAAHQTRESGLPILRHHVLTFTNDEQAIAQKYQYSFGHRLLVAPVFYQGATDQHVYLPKGENWIDISSVIAYDEKDGRYRIGYSDIATGGQTVHVSAPLDVCPLFVRAGSIIPTIDPTVYTLNNATQQGVVSLFDKRHILHLWVFPDASLHATSDKIFDGSKFDVTPSGTGMTLTMADPLNRTLIVQIISAKVPKEVTGASLFGKVASWSDLVQDGTASLWSYDAVQKTIWIRAASAKQVNINF
jgi:alpha-glucosidase (family GH31 glycosyl hydrolase)